MSTFAECDDDSDENETFASDAEKSSIVSEESGSRSGTLGCGNGGWYETGYTTRKSRHIEKLMEEARQLGLPPIFYPTISRKLTAWALRIFYTTHTFTLPFQVHTARIPDAILRRAIRWVTYRRERLLARRINIHIDCGTSSSHSDVYFNSGVINHKALLNSNIFLVIRAGTIDQAISFHEIFSNIARTAATRFGDDAWVRPSLPPPTRVRAYLGRPRCFVDGYGQVRGWDVSNEESNAERCLEFKHTQQHYPHLR